MIRLLPERGGWLEVVCGPMFSGKSEELIRRVKRAVIARRGVQVFKPAIDDRFGVQLVRSHDGDEFIALPVRAAADIASAVGPETSVVGMCTTFTPRKNTAAAKPATSPTTPPPTATTSDWRSAPARQRERVIRSTLRRFFADSASSKR